MAADPRTVVADHRARRDARAAVLATRPLSSPDDPTATRPHVASASPRSLTPVLEESPS